MSKRWRLIVIKGKYRGYRNRLEDLDPDPPKDLNLM
jgi:hypothetical protein